jgi:hypothetical protein
MNGAQMTDCPSIGLGQLDKTKCGTLMVFVNLVSYSGASVEMLMQEDAVASQIGLEAQVLSEAAALSDQTGSPATGADSVSINPTLADGLAASPLPALVSTQTKILDFLEKIKNTKAAAQNLSEIFTDRVAAALEIITPQVFTDGLTVNTISSGKDAITFMSDSIFFGRPYFTTDTAGFAKIVKGDQSVDVVFDREYLEQPIVNVTLTVDSDPLLKTETDTNKIQEIKDAQAQTIKDLFAANVQFLVVNKSEKGFTITLKDKATQDINFSWVALAVKNAKTFFSLKSDNIETPVAIPTPDSVVTPAPDSAPAPETVQTPTSETTPAPMPDQTPTPAPTASPEPVPTQDSVPTTSPDLTPPQVPTLSPEAIPVETPAPTASPEPVPTQDSVPTPESAPEPSP